MQYEDNAWWNIAFIVTNTGILTPALTGCTHRAMILCHGAVDSPSLLFPLRLACFPIKISRNAQWEHLFDVFL